MGHKPAHLTGLPQPPPPFSGWPAQHPGHLPRSSPRPACPQSSRVAPTGKLAPQEGSVLGGKWGAPARGASSRLLPWTASRYAFSGGFAEKSHMPGHVCCWAFEAVPSQPPVTRDYTSLLASGLCFPTSFGPNLYFPNTRSAFRARLRPCSREDWLGKGGILFSLGFEDWCSQG